MVVVIVRMRIRPGCMQDFLKLIRPLRLLVLEEEGCLGYEYHTVPSGPGFKERSIGPDEIVLIEKWMSEEDLSRHGEAEHMARFISAAERLRESSEVTVVEKIQM